MEKDINTKFHRKTELFLVYEHAKYGFDSWSIRSNPGGPSDTYEKKLKKILSPKIDFKKSFWGRVMNLGA